MSGDRDDSAPGPSSPDPGKVGSRERSAVSGKPANPFDLWLERSLHRMFDDIAQEPIPESLLKIIEQDRQKKD